jgi:methylamine utilization protein MauE
VRRLLAPLPLRSLICVILLWAAIPKIFAPAATDVAPRTILDRWVQRAPSLRILVPSAEIGLAIWLLWGTHLKTAAFAAIVLFSAYAGTIAAELPKERPVGCGCGLVTSVDASPGAVRRSLMLSLSGDILLVAACAKIFFCDDTRLDRMPMPYSTSTAEVQNLGVSGMAPRTGQS